MLVLWGVAEEAVSSAHSLVGQTRVSGVREPTHRYPRPSRRPPPPGMELPGHPQWEEIGIHVPFVWCPDD